MQPTGIPRKIEKSGGHTQKILYILSIVLFGKRLRTVMHEINVNGDKLTNNRLPYIKESHLTAS